MREPDAADATAERGREGDGRPVRLYDLSREDLPPALVDYLRERRRAIITELRKIEAMLGMEPSIPERRRPH